MAFFSQTVVGFFIYGFSYRQVDVVMFNGFFCAMLGAVVTLLKMRAEKGKEENNILPGIILSSLAYAGLATMWPTALPHIE